MQAESSMTMTPPEPAMLPAFLRASNSQATSSSSAPSTGADEPPGMTALILRPGKGPPQMSCTENDNVTKAVAPEVRVHSTVFPNTTITMKGASLLVKEEWHRATFYEQEGEVKVMPLM